MNRSFATTCSLTLLASCLVFQASFAIAAEPTVIENSIGMKLALIPDGEFVMGSPPKERERVKEETRHRVIITKAFYMGVYEVSRGEYGKVVGAGKRCTTFDKTQLDHPAETIEWKEAAEFCKQLSARKPERAAKRTYRLPTEAEWEYACRAGSKTPFFFGTKLSASEANFNGAYPYGGGKKGPYKRQPVKVGSYSPNAFGLYDMHGNVAEWCADWYDKNYYGDSPLEDPLGPPFGVDSDDFKNFFLVVRGGSWVDDARALRSSYRQQAMHRNRYQWIGFRVVCEREDP